MQKRGVSEVVTAILLILLAVAAVVIVWAFVLPMIKKPTTTGGTDCVTISLDVVSANNNTGKIVVKRNPGTADLRGADVLVIYQNDTSDKTSCDALDGLEELETATCNAAAGSNWKKVEVYPRVGEDKVLCQSVFSKTL